MRGTCETADAGTTENHRLKSQDTDSFVIEPVGRELLGPVAKVIWPGKTAEKLATIADADVRTAARWISGEVEAPPIIFTAIQVALTRRRRRRR